MHIQTVPPTTKLPCCNTATYLQVMSSVPLWLAALASPFLVATKPMAALFTCGGFHFLMLPMYMGWALQG